jgi:alpha-ketoglutarate-dependent taurine dioxygenase
MSAVIHAPSFRNPSAEAPAGPLEVLALAGRIGAEIRGVRLSGELQTESFRQIHAALLKHKVIFFRGQQHLDNAGHEAFARLFGPLIAHPTVPTVAGAASLMDIDSQHGGRANSWHTDMTFTVAYPRVSVLRGVVIPPSGGDTVWANTAAAYEHLPPALQALALSLRAVHGNDYDYAGSRPASADVADEGTLAYRKTFTAKLIETEHALVQVHPETGERVLLLGHFAKRLVGQSAQDSAYLIGLLQSHITRLENTVRWRWTEGDVAIWDNRATQHYAINDYGDQHRVVRRVTVAGDVPRGVDGRTSVAVTAA